MPSGGSPFRLTETDAFSPTNSVSGSMEVITDVPLGKVGGLAVIVGVMTGVCGSGVGVHGIVVGVSVGRTENVGVGDDVLITGILVGVGVTVTAGGMVVGCDDREAPIPAHGEFGGTLQSGMSKGSA